MTTTSMTTQEVLDAVARERGRLMEAVDALGAGASTVPVTAEGWTSKDVLAHLIHWAGQIAFGVGAPLQPPAYVVEETKRRELAGITDRPTGEEWNALAVAYYRDVPLDAVRDAFNSIVDALAARVRLRSDAQINAADAIPWAGALPLWQLIGGDTFLHWPSHSGAIERAM
jgi:hypothetical protein